MRRSVDLSRCVAVLLAAAPTVVGCAHGGTIRATRPAPTYPAVSSTASAWNSSVADHRPARTPPVCRAGALRLRGVGTAGGSGYRSDVFALRNDGRRPCTVTSLQASFGDGPHASIGSPSPHPGRLLDERTNGEAGGGILPAGRSVRLRLGYIVAPEYRGRCRPQPAGDELVRVNDITFAVPIDWFEVCTTPRAAPWISWHVARPQESWPEGARQPRAV